MSKRVVSDKAKDTRLCSACERVFGETFLIKRFISSEKAGFSSNDQANTFTQSVAHLHTYIHPYTLTSYTLYTFKRFIAIDCCHLNNIHISIQAQNKASSGNMLSLNAESFDLGK